MKKSYSDLHETGYAHNGLICLIEDIPPRKCRSMGTRVLGVLRQEAYNILHAPLSPSQLGTEETSSGIVSKKRLQLEEQRMEIKISFNIGNLQPNGFSNES